MIVKVNCVVCGNQFFSKQGNALYCSADCKRAEERKRYRAERMKMKADKNPKKKGMSITEIAVAAGHAGMTYGQYVAKMGL